MKFSTSRTYSTAFKFKKQQHIMRLCEYIIRIICDSIAVQIGCNVFVIIVKFGCTKFWALLTLTKLCYICGIGFRLQIWQLLQTAEVIIFQNANVMRYWVIAVALYSVVLGWQLVYASFHKFVGQKQLSTRTLQISN